MSFKASKSPPRYFDNDVVEIKSKFDAEFRRFSLDRRKEAIFDEFHLVLCNLHRLEDIPIIICYTDQYGDLLPINNNDNYQKALSSAKPVLRIQLQRKGESYLETNGFGGVQMRKRNPIISKLLANEPRRPQIRISQPEDFRRVSAIIDVDIVPETCRRVKLMKNGQDKPLGFYIRDGTSLRATPNGIEKVPGIFISRLVPGGLAESTGLVAVNDEVLEVNGIEVAGKTLDQVTDMMVANSANLIVTVKPVNQRNTLARPQRGGAHRQSQLSQLSTGSSVSKTSVDSDEVMDFTMAKPNAATAAGEETTTTNATATAAEAENNEEHDDNDDDDDDDGDEVCHHVAELTTGDDDAVAMVNNVAMETDKNSATL